MNVGLLLVTHEGVGPALLAVAERLLGKLPLEAACFVVPYDLEPMRLIAEASAMLKRCDGGEGVLVLTDLYGASPSNMGARIAQLGTPVRRVAGLNLPMLMRVLNYAEQPLDELARIAASGGRTGVVVDHA